MTTAWDPVQPGALIKRLGDLIIVNQSVKVLLKFDNISTVRKNVGHMTHQSRYTNFKGSTGNL